MVAGLLRIQTTGNFGFALLAQDVACYGQNEFYPIQAILKGRSAALSLYPLGWTFFHQKIYCMPRHNKAADRRRGQRIEFRVSVDEAHELITRAINAGLSLSDFIRKSTLGDDAYMQQAPPDKAALITELNTLNTIGNVLIQIACTGTYANNPGQAELLTETLASIKTLSGHLIQKLST